VAKKRRVITAEQSIAEQKQAHPFMRAEVIPDISMIVPGRRALGESWQQVVIGHDADNITVQTTDTEAPADGKPIMAMSGPDAMYAKYILDAQMEKAKSRSVLPSELSRKENYEALNEAFHNLIEEKLAWLKGRSSFGAAGAIQRQRVVQSPRSRPTWHK
jgi:hypothetical protein